MPDRFMLVVIAEFVATAGCCGCCRTSCGASHSHDADHATAAASVSREQASPTASTALDTRKRHALAVQLMLAFAERTGLDSKQAEPRYLWTDAFAVCNLLGLARETGDARQRALALRLVDRVHHILGQYRADDPRKGWISGASAKEGEAHPTRGGLRIGKPRPERKPYEPFDEALEWERDGQYFHYLTKWMHALDQVTRTTGRPEFNRWARELAEAAHRAFVYTVGGQRRMFWKMSIDLKRPLVSSMGQHDALDGYVTSAQLRATAHELPGATGPMLDDAMADFASMLKGQNLVTSDPLGIGGLLMDAYRIDQMARSGALSSGELRDELLRAAATGLEWYVQQGELERPADRRLAFRELGLAIGLDAVSAMREAAKADARGSETRVLLERLTSYEPLGSRIVDFWLEPAQQRAASFVEDRDINEVMLATALAPDGCLVLSAPPEKGT